MYKKKILVLVFLVQENHLFKKALRMVASSSPERGRSKSSSR